jgi:hypothetical protein
MDAWQAVMLGLAALLVGALLPAVVQLTLALRALRATAARTDLALVAVTDTAQRLDRLAKELEAGGRVERFFEAVDTLSTMASKLSDTARLATAVGAAVGPAVGAAVRAWRSSRGEGESASAQDDTSPNTTA